VATRAAAAPATRATRATRGAGRRAAGTNRAAAVVAATRRSFRVSYVAVRVFVANDMADAIRQAQAAGATDITSIARS